MGKTVKMIRNLFNFIIIMLLFLTAHVCFAAPAKTVKPDYFDLSADTIQAGEGSVTAAGNVVIKQSGISIKADSVRFDNNTNLITAGGAVVIEYGADKFSGHRLIYNVKTREAVMYDLSGSMRSLSIEDGQAKGELVFAGRKLLSDDKEINLYDMKATTCENPVPHYYITAKRVTVYPEDRLVARDASFYFDNKFLFKIPSIVYSLKPRSAAQRFQTTIPKVSSNNIDGLGINESFNYLWGKNDYGVIRADWYQKNGLGLGIDHYFDLGGKGNGYLHYYNLGSTNPTGSTAYRHEYGAKLNYSLPMDMKLDYVFSSNSYVYPDNSIYPAKSSSLNLTRYGDKSSFTASSTLYNIGYNLNQGYNLYHRYKVSNSLTSFFNFDYSKNSSVAGYTYNVHPVLRLYNQGKYFDAQFSYERTGGSIQNGFDREPEVSLTSHRIPFGPVDLQATASSGLFREKPALDNILRSYFEVGVPYKVWKMTNKSYFDLYAYAGKYWYGNGNGYRVFYNRAGVFDELAKSLTARLDFYYQSPKGNPAIALDKLNYYKLLLGSLNVFDGKNYYFTVGTSYNLDATAGKRWQDLLCRLNVTPGNFGTLNFGANYNTRERNWQSLDAQFDLMITKTINVRYWAEYDLKNRALITQDYSIVQDFHCWEARAVYRGFSNQWWFDVVLKAFPSEDITVGANQTKPILPIEGWQRF